MKRRFRYYIEWSDFRFSLCYFMLGQVLQKWNFENFCKAYEFRPDSFPGVEPSAFRHC